MAIYNSEREDSNHTFDVMNRISLQQKPDNSPAISSKTTQLIVKGHYQEALNSLVGQPADLRVNNVKAVLQMRLGRPDQAVNLLRGSVLDSATLMLKPKVPTPVVLNFATALLMAGHVAGCVGIIDSIDEPSNQQLMKIKTSVRNWENSLPFFRRMNWKLFGIENLSGNFPFGDAPGRFEWETPSNTRPNVESSLAGAGDAGDAALAG